MDTPWLAALKRQPTTRTHFLYGKRVWIGEMPQGWFWQTRPRCCGPFATERQALEDAHLALAPLAPLVPMHLALADGRATLRRPS